MRTKQKAHTMDTLARTARIFAEKTQQPWDWENTGGGCTALMLEITADHYLMVTHSEDASIPDKNEPHCLGEYANDDPINMWYFSNRAETIKFLKIWGSYGNTITTTTNH